MERFFTRTDDYQPVPNRLKRVRLHRPRQWVDLGTLGTERSAIRTRYLLTERFGTFGFLFRVASDGLSIETFWREPRMVTNRQRSAA